MIFAGWLLYTPHGIMLQDFPFPADQEVEGDKRNDFNFKIINFPNMCSNIPASAYGVYISQLIRYARASRNYSDFLKRHLYLRNRLLDKGYKKIRLIRSLKKLYSDTKILSKYILSLQTMENDGFS